MQKKKYMIIGIVILILSGIFLISSMGSDVNQISLNKTDFIETISASGRVEAANRISMTYQKSGTVEEIFVNEGDVLEKGTEILSLIKDEEENALQSSIIQLRLAENDFSNIAQRVTMAQVAYEAAKNNRQNLERGLERNKALEALGAVSKMELENSEQAVKQALSAEVRAQTEYQGLLPGGVIWESSRLAVETARIQVERSEIEKNKKILFAPFDGIVLEISDQLYSNVQNGQQAIVFAEQRSFVIADIDERDYQKVKPEQRVFIQLINSEQIIEGIVRDVSPKIDRTRGTVRVRIDLSEEISLTTDTGVNIEIIVNEYQDVFLIPESYVKKNPARIIINQNNRASVIELETFSKVGNFYLVESPDLTPFSGANIVSGSFKDGERIK